MKKARTVLTEWALGRITFHAGRNVHVWTNEGFNALTESIKTGNAMGLVEGIVKGEVVKDDVRAMTNWKRMMAVRDCLKVLGYLDSLTPLWLSKRTGIRLMWRHLTQEAIDRGIDLDSHNEPIAKEGSILEEKSIDSGPATVWEIKT